VDTVGIVARVASPKIERTPVSAHSGPRAPTDPRLEVSLGSSTLVAGEPLTGACALFNVDDREPRHIDVELRPSFTRPGVTGDSVGRRRLVMAPGTAGRARCLRTSCRASSAAPMQ
jgi:hypothetical protein